MGESGNMIHVDPEFRSLIPQLAASEREQLEANIVRDGCRDPLVVWKSNGILLDGHNRHEICQKHGIAFGTSEIEFDTRNDALAWLIRNQFGRRNLSPMQRAELALRLEPLIAAKAKERQISSLKHGEDFKCADCGELFASAVWHCKKCNHHYGEADDECGNCHAKRPVLQKSVKRENIDTQKELARVAGVSHDTIHKAKAIAERAPEAMKEKVRRNEVSINEAYTKLKSEERETKKLATLDAKVAAAEAVVNDDPPTWEIIEGDCVDELGKIESGSVNLIFADPPYNIGVDYGDGSEADRFDDDEFIKWVEKWIALCDLVLAENGSLWLMIGDEYAAEFAIILKRQGLTIRNWIKWYESFGVNCNDKFNRCSRHIFYATKSADDFTFNANAEQVRRKSDRQTIYNDSRANPNGKLVDDVWFDVPRLVGTAEERIPTFPTQLPVSLLERIVAVSSMPGETVLDPFNGSGTTGVACLNFGRKYIGIEKQSKFAALARKRLTAESVKEHDRQQLSAV